MTVLDRILATKREEVTLGKATYSTAELEQRARGRTAARGFKAALDAKSGPALIAEIKQASPSKGKIRNGFRPPSHARAYEAGGAACLSVLTDRRYFRGERRHLVDARTACSLPVLRKDFIVDPWQVLESRAMGADAVLIIVAALDDGAMEEIEAAAIELGMDALVEVHDARQLERALKLRSRLIGVNNRDLRDFTVNFERTYELIDRAPPGYTFVAESGLSTYADLNAMADHGIRCFLVGESLMRQSDLEAATRALLGG